MDYWKNTTDLTIDGEIWKPVSEYADLYHVSNYGRVKRLPKIVSYAHAKGVNAKIRYDEKILMQTIGGHGYLLITLTDKFGIQKSARVHRIVCKAFIELVDGKPQVNHIDGNKQNNRVENLEWADASDQMNHAYSHNLIKVKVGDVHAQSKRVYHYNLSGELIGVYGSCGEAHRKTNLSLSHINKCCNGQFDFYKGSVFSYKELNREYFNREFKSKYDKDLCVIKKTLEGEEVCRYRNAKTAAKENEIPYISIYYNLTKRAKSAYGYIWEYA